MIRASSYPSYFMQPYRSREHICNSHDPVDGDGIHSPHYKFLITEGLPQLQSSVASHKLATRKGAS